MNVEQVIKEKGAISGLYFVFIVLVVFFLIVLIIFNAGNFIRESIGTLNTAMSG